jgi:ribose/xylose/arabinose/galactoside ABC-type transport system permease subunit
VTQEVHGSGQGSRIGNLAMAVGRGGAASRLVLNIIALLALVAIFTILSDKYLTPVNAANVLDQISVVVIVGCFFTLLMVAGGIDLSIGGVLGVSGMVCVLLINAGLPTPLAILVAILVGTLVGVFNGLLVAVLGINTVIATLGTLYVTRGATQVLGGGVSIRPADPDFSFIGNGSLGALPVTVVIMAVVFVVALILERRTAVGRYAVLVGANTKGARLNGVPVRRVHMLLFVLTGAAAGLAGVMASSRYMAAQPGLGTGFEFDVLIATLLGGTSLLGGEGSVLGLLLGALIVGSVTTGLNQLGVPSFIQTVLLGIVLLAAVGFDVLVRGGRPQLFRRRSLIEA